MSKARGWLSLILACHEEQTLIITEAVRKDMYRTQLEIERLYATVTSGAIRYDDVPGGGAGDDDKLADVIDQVNELRAAQEERCRKAYEKLQKIRAVEWLVHGLPEPGRGTLIAMYYPRRTMKAAAEICGVSERELGRRRDEAVEELYTACEKAGIIKTGEN